MNATTVISVNPGLSTPGALHPDVTAGIIRHRLLKTRKKNQLRHRIDSFFGMSKSTALSRSKQMLAARLVFGAAFFITLTNAGVDVWAAFVFVSFLAIGLLQRPAMIMLSVFSSVLCVSSIFSGVLDSGMLMTALSSAIFAFYGAGNFSVDALLRKSIYRSISRNRQRERLSNLMSYKAYGYIRKQTE